jgi:hypothetical protein
MAAAINGVSAGISGNIIMANVWHGVSIMKISKMAPIEMAKA